MINLDLYFYKFPISLKAFLESCLNNCIKNKKTSMELS